MSVDDLTRQQAPDGSPSEQHTDSAGRLIDAMMRDPAGQVSPSLYETARLVSLSPWLTGHAERVRYLLESQRADGGWGPPDGYALVPTLSATEALLTVLGDDPSDEALTRAVDRGLQALTRLFGAAQPVPDTPANDLIVPALTAAINEHLRRPDAVPGLAHWRASPRLGLPVGMDGRRLAAVRQMVAAGERVPDKLLHALEVVGDLARTAAGVQPSPSGTIGASPAATAAWLGWPDTTGAHHRARTYLESVVGRYGGPAPCATPITVFERAWVVGTLTRAGITVPASPDLVRTLTADLTPAGTPAGPGLPADADTTSVALYALARLGVPTDIECLWRYETSAGFCTWPGEDGFSVTTNAHVLDAVGQHLAARPDAAPRHRATVERLAAALMAHQRPDGSWQDRWHASPYYATMCCALALAEFAEPSTAAASLAGAADWVVGSQRPDGSWGRWDGTVEETAYAMHVLHATGRHLPEAREAAHRGYAYLMTNRATDDDGPALWHDKDLYRPTMIVRAAVLAALHVAAGIGPARRPRGLPTCPV